MKRELENIHRCIYGKRIQIGVFAVLCMMIFVYGFMYRIIDLRFTFWCAIPFVVYYLFKDTKKNYFDFSFLLLTVATLIIANIAYMREPGLAMVWSDVRLVFVFPMVYMLGCAAVGDDIDKTNTRVFYSLTALNLGMWGQVLLDYINRHFEPRDGFTWFSFWKDDYEARTVFDIGFLLMVSSLFYGIKIRKKNKVFFLISVLGTIASLIMTLFAGGRTATCVCVVVFFLCALTDAIQNRLNYSRQIKKIIGFMLIVVGVIGIVALILFFNNFLGIRKIYESSYWSRQGGIVHNIRFEWAREALRYAISNPEGGWALEANNGGTHNTWLEFARNYNTFVFVIIVCYLVVTLLNVIVILIKEKNPIKYYIMGAVVSMFIYFNMEPVGAVPAYYYVIFFIFISGISNNYYRQCGGRKAVSSSRIVERIDVCQNMGVRNEERY
jgi:hypothetical protein